MIVLSIIVSFHVDQSQFSHPFAGRKAAHAARNAAAMLYNKHVVLHFTFYSM